MARTKQTARLTPKELAELEAERKRVYRARVVRQLKKAKRVKKAKTMKKAKKANFLFIFASIHFLKKRKICCFIIFSEHFVKNWHKSIFWKVCTNLNKEIFDSLLDFLLES